MNSNSLEKSQFSEVPELTLLFWIIKIVATTLGETAGDALSMSLDLGYLISTEIFAFPRRAAEKSPLIFSSPKYF